MASRIGFEFPVNVSEQWDGFNDPGIEYYNGSPYHGLGRETTQNSLDATEQPPAKVEFHLIEVAAREIPGFSELHEAIGRCLEAAAKVEGDKARRFFENAVALSNAPKIKILQVADYSTTGLKGPCQNGTPYFALLKAKGQSVHKDDTSIGSYGIGKFAPFAVSDLRTVFVSTVWEDKHEWKHYAQGKAVLMSHYDKDGRIRQGTGFWGYAEKCLPVEGLDGLPAWLQRAQHRDALPGVAGTTVSILGFRPEKSWRDKIAAVTAENFFGAIDGNRLEVSIHGGHSIKANNLRQIFDDSEVKQSISELKGEPENFTNSRLFLEVIANGASNVVIERCENANLGKCEIRLLVREDLPKRVAILRDGMLITQQLQGLRRFGEFKEFAAVVECLSPKGNALLRAMEPPKHDDFEPDRLSPKDIPKGRVALRELAKWVRDMLRRHAQDPVSEKTNPDELNDFFPDEAATGQAGTRGEVDPAGKVIVRARPLPRRKPASPEWSTEEERFDRDDGEATETGGEGAETDGQGDHGGSRSGDGGGGPNGSNNNEGGSQKPMPIAVHGNVRLHNVRSLVIGPRSRRLCFTPSKSGELRLMLQDSGADTNRKLPVAQASLGRIQQGVVAGIKVREETRCSLDVELAEDFSGTLRLVADAV